MKFKYICQSEGNDEFYDLKRDPFELNNITDIASDKKDRMKKILESKYHIFLLQSKGITPGKIDKKYIEELKALGYIK